MSKALISIGFIQVLIILINIGRGKILSILLGPAGFGVVSTIDQIVVSAIQLGGLAVPALALKLMSNAHSESQEKFQNTYSSFLSGIFGLSLFTTVLILLSIWLKPDLFGQDIVPYIDYLNLALFSVPTLMMALFFVNTLASAQKSSLSIYLHLIVTLLMTSAGCLGVYFGGILGLYIATIPTGIVTSICAVIFIGKKLRLKTFNSSANLIQTIKEKPEIVSMAMTMYARLSAYSLLMLTIRFFVFAENGEVQVGFLQALLSIALALAAVVGQMTALVFMPLVNRAIPIPDKLTAAYNFQSTIIFLIATVSLPFLLFPKLTLFLLFSSKFIVVAQVVYLFIVWQYLFQIVNVYQQLLVGLDDMLFCTISSIFGNLFSIFVSLFLIPSLGLSGTAMSLILGITTTGLIIVYRLKTKFDSPVPIPVWSRTALILAGLMLTGILFNQIDEWSPQGLFIRFGFSCIYLLGLWCLLSGEQKEIIMSFRRKLPF